MSEHARALLAQADRFDNVAPMLKRHRKSAKQQLREDAPEYRVNGADASPSPGEEGWGEGRFRFIDLFCGIGGFRIAFERAGAKCVFSSDWDKFSQQTYAANFGETPHGDIHSVAVAEIPKFDILCGGFPCQPFSLAGVSKKNSLGRKHGFEDVKQGNLFFSIADILEYHQPPGFVLENVKHLVRHDQGRTFKIIHDTLTDALGYQVFWRIINAQSVVPQHRQRIFLVGFKPGRAFEFPEFPAEGPKLASILDPDVPDKYTLTDHLWNYLQNYAKKHQAAGHGFGFGLVTGNDVARTLSARYHKDGSEILISQGQRKNPRRPTSCGISLRDAPRGKPTLGALRRLANAKVVPRMRRSSRRRPVAATLTSTVEKPPNASCRRR
jgi:DNA (cytosine-5)-methyltransferase 1